MMHSWGRVLQWKGRGLSAFDCFVLIRGPQSLTGQIIGNEGDQGHFYRLPLTTCSLLTRDCGRLTQGQDHRGSKLKGGEVQSLYLNIFFWSESEMSHFLLLWCCWVSGIPSDPAGQNRDPEHMTGWWSWYFTAEHLLCARNCARFQVHSSQENRRDTSSWISRLRSSEK